MYATKRVYEPTGRDLYIVLKRAEHLLWARCDCQEQQMLPGGSEGWCWEGSSQGLAMSRDAELLAAEPAVN